MSNDINELEGHNYRKIGHLQHGFQKQSEIIHDLEIAHAVMMTSLEETHQNIRNNNERLELLRKDIQETKEKIIVHEINDRFYREKFDDIVKIKTRIEFLEKDKEERDKIKQSTKKLLMSKAFWSGVGFIIILGWSVWDVIKHHLNNLISRFAI